MSAISEKVRTALYTKMNVSGVTTLAKNGIHYQIAPAGTECPYIIFNRQASKDAIYTFGFTLSHEDDLWLIKAVTDKDSSTIASPQSLGQQILTAAESVIGQSLTLTGSVTWMVLRSIDIPNYVEKLTDRHLHHQGFLLRVVAV